ncbi:MAG TPA: hypothetical protein VF461_10235 [Gemmatimonadaceae bacterium]
MKARVITSVAAAGALAMVACTQDLAKSPLVPTQASFSVTPLACSFPTIRANAAAYFANAGDPVFALIDAMDHAGAIGQAARTSAGFDVLARLGAAADIGAAAVKGTPAQGSAFANSVLACMTVSGYTGPIDFTDALGPNGLFGVRDGNGNAAVTSRLLGTGGAPAFGAEPGDTGNWPLAGKTLFYGNQLNLASLGNETPAGDLFELTTLPSNLTFTPQIKVGVCELSDPNGRILHLHAADPGVILSPAPALSFCGSSLGSAGSSTSLFAAAASRIGAWFAPATASAAPSAFKASGGGAGLVGGLSKIGPVSYTSTMAWVVKPGNSSRSKSPQFTPVVTVRNGSTGGNALEGATITLIVSTNKGSFTITGNTAVTNAAGIATFPNLKIDKPGGYTLTAVSELGGSISTFFNIDGH